MNNPYLNRLSTAFAQRPWFTVKGPVLCSQKYDQRFNQTMQYSEMEVANGTFVPEEDVPFGMFVEIQNERNSSKSRMVIAHAPLNAENEPVFRERCEVINNYSEYICKAKKCVQIVPKDTEPSSGTGIWESSVQPFDDKHALRTTVTVLQVNVVTKTVYDELLKEWHTVTYTLTQTLGASGLFGGFFVSYEKVNCSWYMKISEAISTGEKLNLCGTTNYGWPNVLLGVTFGVVTGITETGDEYNRSITVDKWMKWAYNGPCKAEYLVSFETAIEACTVPTQMVTDTIEYEGIFFNFSLHDCLHGLLQIRESTGTEHPELVYAIRSRDYPATELTDWPEHVIADVDFKPYKGGYVKTTTKIYSPVTAERVVLTDVTPTPPADLPEDGEPLFETHE